MGQTGPERERGLERQMSEHVQVLGEDKKDLVRDIVMGLRTACAGDWDDI